MSLFNRRTEQPKISERIAAAMVRRAIKRVLFVDDDPALNEFVAQEVAPHFQMDLKIASSIAEARQAIAAIEFDAAVLDYRLVNGNGVALYRELSARFPAMQFVFLTAHDSPELRETVYRIGPARVYRKMRLFEASFLRQLFSQFGVKEREPEPVPA